MKKLVSLTLSLVLLFSLSLTVHADVIWEPYDTVTQPSHPWLYIALGLAAILIVAGLLRLNRKSKEKHRPSPASTPNDQELHNHEEE